ncbi:MAG: hypothetical protein BMS9Abin13_220 [Patescibacteria group bacterium]|nr:MAG: hypothetical protein BMS9Abin13_220 [Patescibacteria group bacterium]
MLLFVGAVSVLPALFWLWFWLKEDVKKPEPRGLLAAAFVAGMIVVFAVLPLERLAYSLLSDTTHLIVAWAATEEVLKYLALFMVAMRSRYFDEPIDGVIYAITVALGFAAMENFLYIINTIADTSFAVSILNGNLRFIGATLLHTVSSAAIGIAIAFSFYMSRAKKALYTAIGISVAILLHTLFNLFIIRTESVSELLAVFSSLWIIIIIVLVVLEKIKRIKARS